MSEIPPPAAIAPPSGINDEQFYADLAGLDAMGMVLRGAIYIEHELMAYADEASASPAAIKKLQLDFSGRVHLAVVLGMPEEHAPALLAFGSVRNGFAHKLSATIGRQEVKNIRAAMSKEQLNVLQTAGERTAGRTKPFRWSELDYLDQLRLLIIVLRQGVRYGRMLLASAHADIAT